MHEKLDVGPYATDLIEKTRSRKMLILGMRSLNWEGSLKNDNIWEDSPLQSETIISWKMEEWFLKNLHWNVILKQIMSYASIDGFTKAINMGRSDLPYPPTLWGLAILNFILISAEHRNWVSVVLSPWHAEYRLYIVVKRQVYKSHLVNSQLQQWQHSLHASRHVQL